MTDTITIIDDRTGKQITVPIDDGVFPSSALRELDPDLRMYDPAFLSTAACSSAVTYLDGDAGILRYRGYPIEQLAEHSTYLEVAYLLLNGELPTASSSSSGRYEVTHHTFLHDNVRKRFMEGFHYDAHPMGMFVSGLAALSTYYLEAKDIFDQEHPRTSRSCGSSPRRPRWPPTATASASGMPTVYPDNSLSYTEQLPQHDVQGRGRLRGARRSLARGLDVLVHPARRPRAELRHHGDARASAPAHADPFIACSAAGVRALRTAARRCQRGSRAHARRDRLRARTSPGSSTSVKAGKGRLMGFGHRVYKNYDPRATIIKQTAVRRVRRHRARTRCSTSRSSSRRRRSSDDYFESRKLYPNVDFYSGLIYQAMDFPIDMFTVLFAIPRTSGWLTHWVELLNDKEQKIARPRQRTRAGRPGLRGGGPPG